MIRNQIEDDPRARGEVRSILGDDLSRARAATTIDPETGELRQGQVGQILDSVLAAKLDETNELLRQQLAVSEETAGNTAPELPNYGDVQRGRQ